MQLSSWVKTGCWEVSSSYLQSHSRHPTRANKKPRTSSFTASHAQIRVRLPVQSSLLEVCDYNTSGASQSNMMVKINAMHLCGATEASVFSELCIFISSSASLVPYMWPWTTKPVLPLMHGLLGSDNICLRYKYVNIWNLVQKKSKYWENHL